MTIAFVYTENMDEDSTKKEETYTVTFRNGALAKIKKVAADDRLQDVLAKAISVIDAAKEGTQITVKKGKEEYVIDLRQI